MKAWNKKVMWTQAFLVDMTLTEVHFTKSLPNMGAMVRRVHLKTKEAKAKAGVETEYWKHKR